MFYPESMVDTAEFGYLFRQANHSRGLSSQAMALTMLVRQTNPAVADPRYIPDAVSTLRSLCDQGYDVERLLTERMRSIEACYAGMALSGCRTMMEVA